MSTQISDDSQAILMLCSHLGLPPKPDSSPLKLREWNPIAHRLKASDLRPGDLLGKTGSEIAGILKESDAKAKRIASLLDRGGWSRPWDRERMVEIPEGYLGARRLPAEMTPNDIP